ncbi:hypothetical protein KIH31_06830 [Paenarthrobacter sp. DKR-5]|uniref:hypothetical protein n=1 Tax=Paenarthrobacter sp. DKR-5 TaxID=2835535 RepID=UPI001BDCEB4C|nr:hypothetical protein [Paenarthrobacter sp. DKR-5]MBT1002313.1 hypothetical protein [Paenarthrobacter sp. DKR-5]
MDFASLEPAPAPPREQRWRLAEGVSFLGPLNGSGLAAEKFLIRRPDGQIVQVSALLQLILTATAEHRLPADQAAHVTRTCGRELPVELLGQVIERKLRPLGLVHDAAEDSGADRAAPPMAAPLLALRLKGTLLPAAASRRAAAVLAPLYNPPVVVAVAGGLLLLDGTLLTSSDLLAAFGQILLTPALLLGLFVLMMAGALVHELGHAAACCYGGARPGVIGFGVYLVFPAFFTDVTDSYRLGRAGRLRTDLGGLYFNALCVLAAGTGYLLTGSGVLLLFVFATQVQMLQQLPPTVRLDGYFVLSDLAGVPDLFARVGPVVRSLRPGAAPDPRVLELRPASRRIVTAWVLTVIPSLFLLLGWLLWNLPLLAGQTAAALSAHARLFAAAVNAAHPLEAVLSALSMVLLLLPVAGIAVILQQLGAGVLRLVRARLWVSGWVPRQAEPRRFPAGKHWNWAALPEAATAVPVQLRRGPAHLRRNPGARAYLRSALLPRTSGRTRRTP